MRSRRILKWVYGNQKLVAASPPQWLGKPWFCRSPRRRTSRAPCRYHHRGVHENFPKNPKLWEGPHREASQMFMETLREIEDGELFHWSIAERVWMKYATNPEVRAEILDCAGGALKASMEARIRRVELAEKHAI